MANPFKVLLDWFNAEYGDAVSADQAVSIPAMWYGVNKIAGHCGRLPLFINRKLAKGGAEKAPDHWAYGLLKSTPNTYQTADVFREQVTGHAILWGNGRAAIVNRGRPDAELIPLMPDRTFTVLVAGEKYHVTMPDKDDRLPLFESFTNKPRKSIVLHDGDVLHIQGFGFDGIEGISLMSAMRRALGLPISQEEHAYTQTKRGFSAKLMVEAPVGALRDAKDAKEFIDAFNEAHSKSENSGRAGLLREGMKAQVLNMSNEDAQFLEQRRFSRQDVVLMLGLDGMPGDGDNHSFSSKEMEALNYLDNALSKWICRWESQVDSKLLTPKERRDGYYSRYNLQALLRADSQTQSQVISTYITSRVINPNEARAYLDLNPYEGGDAFENPAISPGQTGQEQPPTKKTVDPAKAALRSVIQSLIKREANDAKNGAKKENFCGWIDRFYAKWEPKLADKLEEIGLDRDLARLHCEESRELLLNVAGDSKPDELQAKVEACVRDWTNRAEKLLHEESAIPC